MPHTSNEPPSVVLFWDYWLEIKYFDDSNTLQTIYYDYGTAFDGAQTALDEGFAEAVVAYSTGASPIVVGDELITPSRLYSVTPHKDSAEYDVSPH